MSFSKIHSAQISHLKPNRVDIEVDISRGLYTFSIVGLGDKAVDEAKDRVCSAIKNSGFKAPKQKSEKVVVSLAPAYSKKHGPLFDVAIALGYLEAAGEIDIENKDERLFLGELALNGSLRPVHGILPLTRYAKQKGFKEIFVPQGNAKEAAIVDGIHVYAVKNLWELIQHVRPQSREKLTRHPVTKIDSQVDKQAIDFNEIRGQHIAKRALQLAAAGGHNIALYGPPGTGKTLLAKAFAGIFPAMNFDEILDVTSIYSAAGLLDKPLIETRPFRSPHHSASYAAVCGGGAHITPGEVTLSHKGILFLDELPEFDRKVIESLRQPLEDGTISISRASGSVTYPAEFTLLATLNPCPCGYKDTGIKTCTCTPAQVAKYMQKISGPIADRIDMWIEVGQLSHDDLMKKQKHTNKISPVLQKEVTACRTTQEMRQKKLNSTLTPQELDQHCHLDETVRALLKEATHKLDLSARAVHKTIKLSRTIADMKGEKHINDEHMLEALQYRKKN